MKGVHFVVLAGAVMLEAGCGLPDSFYLAPPIVTTLASQTGSNTFTFANPVHDLNHDINVAFSGDELFYKFYADPSQVELNAYDPSNSSDPSTQLIAKGFWPICLQTDVVGSRSDPPIPENGSAASGSSVTVTINASGESYFVLNSDPAVNIRRDVANSQNSTVYKTFQSFLSGNGTGNGFSSSDSDFASVASASNFNGTTFFAAWYVISYGLTNTSTPSRSVAVYCGYMTMTY